MILKIFQFTGHVIFEILTTSLFYFDFNMK